ncbi:MAG: hypothetical protein WC128_00455 [Bacteroidales bacterium]|jgi:hypothetical protein
MKNIKNNQVLSRSSMGPDDYIPPVITVLEINLEQGFATSSASGSEDWDSIIW